MSFTAPTINWAGLTPVIIILGAGVLGVLIEAFVPRRARHGVQTVLSLLAVLGSGVALAARWGVVRHDGAGTLSTGFAEDPFAVAAQGVLLVIGLLSLLVIADRTSTGEGFFAAQPADRPGSAEETESLHAGWVSTEVFPLTLFSLAGMMLFPVANDLISLFVMLELVSLPLYIMAATARHRRLLSQEAALKYFLLGAFSSAFFLFGSAFVYGATGTLKLSEISAAIGAASDTSLAALGLALLSVGLLFKVGTVPFHSWIPDVYQGAPTPVTAFMAAGVKATAFLALVRFYYVVAGNLGWDLAPFLWTVAILTMVVGTFVGVVQGDVKRMLAYSAIAHAGYMLIGVIAFNGMGLRAILFYALAYGVSTVGAFAVVGLVRQSHDGAAGAEATDLDAWRGLGKRSPWLAGSMALFLLSFAGIPLTAGFIGKFELFIAGVQGGASWLVVAAVISSMITAFFYMRLIVLMFFRDPEGGTVIVRSDGLITTAVALSVILTIVLGVLPQVVLTALSNAAMLVP